jgi:hypothetical protein
VIGPYETRVCEWCEQRDCDCDFQAVDECPPMCDCGGDPRPRPQVTVTAEEET